MQFQAGCDKNGAVVVDERRPLAGGCHVEKSGENDQGGKNGKTIKSADWSVPPTLLAHNKNRAAQKLLHATKI
jgi:hypothetical protein